VSGRDLNAVLSDVRDQVRTTRMPLEYHAEVLGGLPGSRARAADGQGWPRRAAILSSSSFRWRPAAGGWPARSSSSSLSPAWEGGGHPAARWRHDPGCLVRLLAVFRIAARTMLVLVGPLPAHRGRRSGRRPARDRERLGPILLTAGRGGRDAAAAAGRRRPGRRAPATAAVVSSRPVTSTLLLCSCSRSLPRSQLDETGGSKMNRRSLTVICSSRPVCSSPDAGRRHPRTRRASPPRWCRSAAPTGARSS